MPDPHHVLLVQAAATLYMTGLIWFVQVVHYPLMSAVGRDGFAEYEARHTRFTGRVVGPAMLIEALSAAAFALKPVTGVTRAEATIGLGLLVAIWLSTALLQVPQHRRLARGFDERAHRRLVSSNWFRTAAWSTRALLVLYWLV